LLARRTPLEQALAQVRQEPEPPEVALAQARPQQLESVQQSLQASRRQWSAA